MYVHYVHLMISHCTTMDSSGLLCKTVLRQQVEKWLKEDLPPFDFAGSFFDKSGLKKAELFCKADSDVVLCGRPFFDEIFRQSDCTVEWLKSEGEWIGRPTSEARTLTAKVTGAAQSILLVERTALNVLCRTSGAATLTRRCVEAAQKAGWNGRIAATRKTTPGFRLAEKYAVLIGGGDTHRYNLSTMIMLKDNHVDACNGDIELAVKSARKLGGFSQQVEVECRSKEDAFIAAGAGAHIVMLDNFDSTAASLVSAELKAAFPTLTIEASGGIGPANMRDYFSPNIDVISASLLTQGYPICDFSLKLA